VGEDDIGKEKKRGLLVSVPPIRERREESSHIETSGAGSVREDKKKGGREDSDFFGVGS